MPKYGMLTLSADKDVEQRTFSYVPRGRRVRHVRTDAGGGSAAARWRAAPPRLRVTAL